MNLHDLASAVRYEGGISRRLWLAYAAALASLPTLEKRADAADRKVSFPSDPFALGVASGDPEPDGFVLWTKLAPKPLEPDGGMGADAVELAWEVAADDAFRTKVRTGTAVASPKFGHSAHVEVAGLEPDRWYFYRFRAGDATSPVGRTRTAPERAATPEKLRFAFASCQHYEHGLFTAYESMARDELDLIFFLGDYIYEREGKANYFRKHPTGKLKTLADYRGRYALYRSDKLLQAAHAHCPWVVTWDDHEVENNYADARSEKGDVDPVAFLEQRAAAYRAYYEMMPLRERSIPRGPNLSLYRTVEFGRLASFQVLDTRQHRTPQPNATKPGPIPETWPANHTMLGAKQNTWLRDSLAASMAKWNVLAQQVMFATVDRGTDEDPRYSMDQWPGYAPERRKLLEFLADRRIANPVVLTGDIHSNWVNDLRIDDRKPDAPIAATEFVGTSISSGGNGVAKPKELPGLLAKNPCVKFHNKQRGYVRCELDAKVWRTDYRVLSSVTRPEVRADTVASFAVESGTAGATPN